MMKEFILATSNVGKIKELQSMLHPIQCIPQQALGISDAEETGLSFVENAIIKARHASHLGQKPALADDSGLVVPALQGEPGIYSARYAGEKASDKANIARLLGRLSDTPDDARQAYFYCAIVLVNNENDPTPLIATGQFEGVVTTEPKGESGFGYDPIMYLPDYHVTVAELPAGIKNKISHRANALSELLAQLNSKSAY